MYVLITYDVSTVTDDGQRRLRHVAKACLDCGQRVQNSVFECSLDPADFTKLRHRILEIIDLEADSVRFYHLGNNWRQRIEHHGTKEGYDVDGPMIV